MRLAVLIRPTIKHRWNVSIHGWANGLPYQIWHRDAVVAVLLHSTVICTALAAMMAPCVCPVVRDLVRDEIHGNQLRQCIPDGKWLWKIGAKFYFHFKIRMYLYRSTHEVIDVDGFMYSLGGNDGSSSLNSVEKYDPQLNKWTIVASMVTRRSSVGASVLECFNLEKGLVQTTNLWRLDTVADDATTNQTKAATNGIAEKSANNT